jgi:hypothetical protein
MTRERNIDVGNRHSILGRNPEEEETKTEIYLFIVGNIKHG